MKELLVPRREIVLPKRPSYVKLDMAFGVGAGTTLFDRSRYRSHGTITNGSWGTGVHGMGLSFDAVLPTYVEIPATHTQLDFTTEDFSIIWRLYAKALTSYMFIFIRGLVNADGYAVYVTPTGQVVVRTQQSGSTQETVSAAGDVVALTWATIGISRDGSSVTTYKNGVDTTTTPGTHIDPATCARSAKIGTDNDKASFPFGGGMEFLRIFGGIALSASEHLAYHNALA